MNDTKRIGTDPIVPDIARIIGMLNSNGYAPSSALVIYCNSAGECRQMIYGPSDVVHNSMCHDYPVHLSILVPDPIDSKIAIEGSEYTSTTEIGEGLKHVLELELGLLPVDYLEFKENPRGDSLR